MRVLLVHNPGSGEQSHDGEVLRSLIRGAGHDVRVSPTRSEKFERALEGDVDLVVAAGGDGTVRAVGKSLVGRGIPFTILPLGTANNIAGSLGIRGEPAALVAAWPDATRGTMDVGLATSTWGESHFFESVGIGLVAEVLRRERALHRSPVDGEDRHAEMRKGREFFRDVLRDLAPREATLTVDGRTVTGSYLLVAVMKSRTIGPNLQLSPAASMDDGRLHVVLVAEAERAALWRSLDAAVGPALPVEPLPSLTATHVSLEWEGDHAHLDDEIWPEPRPVEARDDATRLGIGPTRRADVTLEAGAIQVLVPKPRS